jgi:ankyrin repeat protein
LEDRIKTEFEWPDNHRIALEKYAFLPFAVTYWARFINPGIRNGDSNDERVWQLFQDLSKSKIRLNFLFWIHQYMWHSPNSSHGETTLLQVAAYFGLEQFVHKLVCDGSDVNVCTESYGTALMMAVLAGDESIVRFLILSNADNIKGGEYGSALQAAAFKCSKAIVGFLIGCGANVNAKGGLYGSALQAAARASDDAISVVKLLVGKGANINHQGGFHDSALQAAVVKGNEEIVRFLCNSGVDVRGGNYSSAQQAAKNAGHGSIYEFLEERYSQEGKNDGAPEATAYRFNNITASSSTLTETPYPTANKPQPKHQISEGAIRPSSKRSIHDFF